MSDNYQITVIMTRSLSDDSDVLEAGGKEVTPRNLAIQAAKELQEAYTDTIVSGMFQITHVEYDGLKTEISP